MGWIPGLISSISGWDIFGSLSGRGPAPFEWFCSVDCFWFDEWPQAARN
jgi:hypothetical protein